MNTGAFIGGTLDMLIMLAFSIFFYIVYFNNNYRQKLQKRYSIIPKAKWIYLVVMIIFTISLISRIISLITIINS